MASNWGARKAAALCFTVIGPKNDWNLGLGSNYQARTEDRHELLSVGLNKQQLKVTNTTRCETEIANHIKDLHCRPSSIKYNPRFRLETKRWVYSFRRKFQRLYCERQLIQISEPHENVLADMIHPPANKLRQVEDNTSTIRMGTANRLIFGERLQNSDEFTSCGQGIHNRADASSKARTQAPATQRFQMF